MGRLTERKMDYCQLMDCDITCTQKELCDDASIYNKLRDYENAEEQGLLVRVVRCKNCIHYEMGVCLKIYDDGSAAKEAWQERKPDDFCSYGERREVDDED